jgi:hypothetical protein
MDRIHETRTGRRRGEGSALILTVVLTSLLAIVGVLFLMASRIDKMATTATADNRQLGFAVDSVVARIGEVLAQDVPVASNGQEYYDYPDANNAWLADLEPYMTPGDPNFYWRQVSNIAGSSIGNTRHVRIRIVGDRESVNLTDPNTNADADGDGVGDARWFAVPGITSNKGDPIYAAVRIVDNGAMLNVNTGDKFDPQDPNRLHVDGHSQLQVNVLALACKRGDLPTAKDEAALLGFRANKSPTAAANLAAYELQETWQYQSPSDVYTPFDLSDELELRYRYLLNQEGIDTRVEDWGWFRPLTVFSTPVDDPNLANWFVRATGVKPPTLLKTVDPNAYYSYRHIATTYNLDRILAPRPISRGPGIDPNKMVNINMRKTSGNADYVAYVISQAVTTALPANLPGVADAAQIIANILDYIDDDSEVTVVWGTGSTSPYFGFERPCIYLSELAYRFVRDSRTNTVNKSYAIELCKPYFDDRDPHPGEWRLLLSNGLNQIITWSGTRQFDVLLSEDSQAPLASGYVSFKDMDKAADAASLDEYNAAKYASPSVEPLDSKGFDKGTTIELQRKVVVSGQDHWLMVDRLTVPDAFLQNSEDGAVHRLQRDISKEKCFLRLWGAAGSATASLGNGENNYISTDSRKIQAHPANRPLVNIGELGMILAKSPYGISDASTVTAENMLINLAEPVYQNLFNYLTVMEPVNRNTNLEDNEMRVKGRININTAPAFVLAQLPWMQYNDPTLKRAQAIVNYRNSYGAFKTIGGLMLVPEMRQLQSDGINNLYDVPTTGPTRPRGPDLTPDTVTDDNEERDLLFTRISDLVTVRSDVFSAYILVRLGATGPQKRVIAILDRGKTESAKDAVRVVSLEQVPDPR